MTENKSGFEQKMTRLNNSIVTIKNISDEDFSHSYASVPYSIKAGETLPFIYPVGMHMAKHLAMRIIRVKAVKEGKLKQIKQTLNLYTKTALSPLIDKIVINTEEKPLPQVKSEGQILKEKTEEMQKQFTDTKVVSKKEVIEELRKRDIRFNSRDSREQLLELLSEADMQGNTGEEK